MGRESSRLEITRATAQMMRRLLVMTQTLAPIEGKAYVTLRLEYFDDTPSDYQPPYFKAADVDTDFLFDVLKEKVNMGDVTTPYHVYF